jgi:chemotaxis signal transduction protein
MINESTFKLRIFARGPAHFGVFENEIAAIVDWQTPAPLPHAPPTVMGVVGVHGRMLTILDVAKIGDQNQNLSAASEGRKIIALRGDEQLALASDSVGEPVELTSRAVLTKSDSRELALTLIQHDEKEIMVLNLRELFPSAIQGRERRRRRF